MMCKFTMHTCVHVLERYNGSPHTHVHVLRIRIHRWRDWLCVTRIHWMSSVAHITRHMRYMRSSVVKRDDLNTPLIIISASGQNDANSYFYVVDDYAILCISYQHMSTMSNRYFLILCVNLYIRLTSTHRVRINEIFVSVISTFFSLQLEHEFLKATNLSRMHTKLDVCTQWGIPQSGAILLCLQL